jgi:hypothetical protein
MTGVIKMKKFFVITLMMVLVMYSIMNLIFVSPCILNILPKYNKQDAQNFEVIDIGTLH